MSQAKQDMEWGAAITGFPRIDRYFPECRIAAIEAVSRFRFGIEDFGKAYGRYTFTYDAPPGPLAFRSNGIELDLYIHRDPLPDRELDLMLEDIYGVHNELVSFVEFEEYRRFCVENIAARLPVITSFDLGFIKERREYGKILVGHAIVLFAYDANSRQLRAGEQTLGYITVDFEDYERCFEQCVARDGAMFVWTVERQRSTERELSREEVSARIRANLDNLTSPHDGAGLLALNRFRKDLDAYFESPEFLTAAKPFAIPGLWVFSHERHILRKWLRAVRPLCSAPEAVDRLDEVLGSLFNRWLSADYLIEKCLISGDGRPLKRLSSHLVEIAKEEQLALDGWRALHAAI